MKNIGLNEIIGQFLNSKDSSTHEFRRIWNMASFGLKTEFNLDITGTLKTVVLDVNANKTVTLPQGDYIGYSKVGMLNHRGEVCTFTVNPQLSTINGIYTNIATSRTANIPTINSFDLTNPYYQYYYNYWWQGDQYNLFGADSGTPEIGQFKIDEAQGVIFLDPRTTHTQIVLEYLSSGFNEEEQDYYLDIRVSQCMLAYLRWQNAIDQIKKFPANLIRDYKRDYFNEKRKAKMRVNKFNVSDFNRAIRVGQKLVAKA